MDMSLDPAALARLAAPCSSTDGREGAGGNTAAFHLPLMDPNVSCTPDNGSTMSTAEWGAAGDATPIFNQANFSFVHTPPATVAGDDETSVSESTARGTTHRINARSESAPR